MHVLDHDRLPPPPPFVMPPCHIQGHGRVNMLTALNVNASVGLFFEDWVEISEGLTLEYEVSLYEDADLDKVSNNKN